MSKSSRSTRRQFLKVSGAATLGCSRRLYFVPSSALGLAGSSLPVSDRNGRIGSGPGRGDIGAMMDFPEVQVIAVCDVDEGHKEEAAAQVNQKYGNKDCRQFKDFRDLLAIKEIDAVTVTTPDHWHALCSVAAANAKKDIYCEKPLANSIGEGRAIADAVKKNNRILQCGSQERSGGNSRYACELVRNGRIGKLHTIRINLPTDDGHHNEAKALKVCRRKRKCRTALTTTFGSATRRRSPYSPKRTHFWWRFILAYGGGEMTDRGRTSSTSPSSAAALTTPGPLRSRPRARGTRESLYNTFWEYKFTSSTPTA